MNKPTTTAGVLPEDVTGLLAAVVEALDVPVPSIDPADERAYHRLLEHRTADVRIALASILKFPEAGISRDAEYIRARTAAVPVTYTPFEPDRDGGAA
ncbi:hypothetical protein ACFWNG_15625 [Streptomyces sp. NPDC058391]|uniref:hypothetical protein n=1 Tax=Streptomyces sp. NPDC058391 TaxID=3346476 RepID=UPI00364BBCB0